MNTLTSVQLTIFAGNRPGTLADICKTLTDRSINIHGITVVDQVDHAVIRLVVDKDREAIHLLEEAGLYVTEGEVIRIPLQGKPGSLEKIARHLHAEGLNIDYAYATSSIDGSASELFIKTSNNEKALKSLQEI
jgi:hypothetical protein